MGDGPGLSSLITDEPGRSVPLSVPPISQNCYCYCTNVTPASCLVKLDSLRIVNTNCRSLNNKLMELEQSLIEAKASLAAVTERWLNPDNEMKIAGYEGFFSSRSIRKG